MPTMKPLLRRSAWRAILFFAVVGAVIPPAVYLFWFTKSGPTTEANCSALLLFVCPIYIWSMAFDHMAVRTVRETIALMSLINAAWYFLIGFIVLVVRESLRKRKAA
jgi:hypothetical protein